MDKEEACKGITEALILQQTFVADIRKLAYARCRSLGIINEEEEKRFNEVEPEEAFRLDCLRQPLVDHIVKSYLRVREKSKDLIFALWGTILELESVGIKKKDFDMLSRKINRGKKKYNEGIERMTKVSDEQLKRFQQRNNKG